MITNCSTRSAGLASSTVLSSELSPALFTARHLVDCGHYDDHHGDDDHDDDHGDLITVTTVMMVIQTTYIVRLPPLRGL